jgi:predicted metalloendopeptidase
MKTLAEYTDDILNKIRKMNQNEQGIVITESNVIELYKKLSDQEVVNQEEIDKVKERFKELCNYGR